MQQIKIGDEVVWDGRNYIMTDIPKVGEVFYCKTAVGMCKYRIVNVNNEIWLFNENNDEYNAILKLNNFDNYSFHDVLNVFSNVIFYNKHKEYIITPILKLNLKYGVEFMDKRNADESYIVVVGNGGLNNKSCDADDYYDNRKQVIIITHLRNLHDVTIDYTSVDTIEDEINSMFKKEREHLVYNNGEQVYQ